MEVYSSFGKKSETREVEDLSRVEQHSRSMGPGQFQPCALSAHLGSLDILGYHGDLRDK